MKTSPKTTWLIIAAVVVVGLIWWGASRSNVASGDTIKIGWVGSLTGEIAAYGEAGRNVTQIAVDEINANGGINGKKIEMVYEDGACNGTTAANAMQKLATVDQVRISFAFCSAEALAAAPIATQNKIVLISQAASTPKLTGISQYFFRDYPSDNSQGKVLADAAYTMKHWRTVAMLTEQNDYATGVSGAFEGEFEKLGGKIVKEEFPTNNSDFRSALLKLKSQQPEALFINSLGAASAPRIFQQMQDLGWKPPLMVNDTIATDAKAMTTFSGVLDGALTAEFAPRSGNAKFQHLAQAYKTKYGTDLPYQAYAQTEYDAVYVIADGIKAVGYDGDALAKWSRTINNWDGASGAITIGPDGDRIGGHTLEVIHNGKAQPFQS